MGNKTSIKFQVCDQCGAIIGSVPIHNKVHSFPPAYLDIVYDIYVPDDNGI